MLVQKFDTYFWVILVINNSYLGTLQFSDKIKILTSRKIMFDNKKENLLDTGEISIMIDSLFSSNLEQEVCISLCPKVTINNNM